LPQHGGGVQRVPPRAGEQVGGPQKDRRAVLIRHRPPHRPGFLGCRHRGLRVCVGRIVHDSQHMPAAVWLDDLDRLPSAHPLLPADGHRQIQGSGGELGESPLQVGPLLGPRGVAADRLVTGFGHGEDGVHRTLLDLGSVGESPGLFRILPRCPTHPPTPMPTAAYSEQRPAGEGKGSAEMNEQRPGATPAPDHPTGRPAQHPAGEEPTEAAMADRPAGDHDPDQQHLHGPADRGTDTGAPGAGTLAVLAVAWLLVMLSSLRQAVGTDAGDRALTITRAALELPQVISASLVTGVAVGLAAGNLLARFRPSVLIRPVRRLLISGAAGAVTGLAVATPVLLGYEHLPSIAGISTAIAVAALLGGLLSGIRHRVVVAAGTGATLAVFLVGLLEQAFQGDLRVLFGAGTDPESVVAASGWVVLTASLVAGAAAGVLSYLYLRRSGPSRLRWPAYLLAGAMPGLLVLAAEVVTRLGGARLFSLVSAASV